jgi:hypothetical protein
MGRLPLVVAAAFAISGVSAMQAVSGPKPTLDYEFFKSKVEPIFLTKRAGHTRCVVCHSENNSAFKLERLPAGGTAWTEEQSRKNFENVSKLVNPGDPETSRLLMQPLAPEGGGNVFHSGGRQFGSKKDLGWKTIAQWVNGAKPSDPKK